MEGRGVMPGERPENIVLTARKANFSTTILDAHRSSVS